MKNVRSQIDMQNQRKLTPDDMMRMRVGSHHWKVKLAEIGDHCPYKEMIEKWISKLDKMLAKGYGLVLTGEFRQGKTSASVICMKATVAHGGTALLIRGDDIPGVIVERTMFDLEDTMEKRMRDVDLLVIDDLGAGGGYEQTKAMVERVIRYRYDHARSLIITTNSRKLIEQKYGDGTAKVIAAICKPVSVDGMHWFKNEKEELNEAFKDAS